MSSSFITNAADHTVVIMIIIMIIIVMFDLLFAIVMTVAHKSSKH